MNIKILVAALFAACTIATASLAQNLFALYEGKTMTFKGKGISSGRSFTIRGEVAACAGSESGLCLGEFPVSNSNYALVFQNENIMEQIHLSVVDGKLAGEMRYVRPNGEVAGVAPLKIGVRN